MILHRNQFGFDRAESRSLEPLNEVPAGKVLAMLAPAPTSHQPVRNPLIERFAHDRVGTLDVRNAIQDLQGASKCCQRRLTR